MTNLITRWHKSINEIPKDAWNMLAGNKSSPFFKWQISGNFPKKPLGRPIDPWKGSLKRGENLIFTRQIESIP